MNARVRKTRILYVVGSFVAGGAERHLLELWGRIDRDRFEVEIVCFRRTGAFTTQVDALGWPVHDLGMNPRIYDPAGWRGLGRLMARIRAFRPDVVQGYLFGPNLFAALAGRICGVRAVVVSKRNVDAFETSRQVWIQRLAHRLATHVVAVSEAAGDSSRALGVPPDRVTVIPNGVDVERFRPVVADRDGRRALGFNGSAPWIGSVGCLEARKDVPTLLGALALLAERGVTFEAVLIGDGRERGRLEALSASLGLAGRVHFLGERGDIERLLPLLDVFVLSSREEGIPNALLEAMACGRPSVATAVGGTPEVLTDGDTGWLVPAGDPRPLADAIQAALTDRSEAERRARRAREQAETRLSIAAMVSRHEALYARLAGVG